MSASDYTHLDRDTLIRLLQRRDAERQLGLVWERNDIEADKALNDDYVALELDPELSHCTAPWDNLIIEASAATRLGAGQTDATAARRIQVLALPEHH